MPFSSYNNPIGIYSTNNGLNNISKTPNNNNNNGLMTTQNLLTNTGSKEIE